MKKVIKNILTTLNDNGYEAYVIGGYTRDYLLGINSTDVDICTNALPKTLKKLFPTFVSSNNYGGINLNIDGFNIDITTFRKEIKYIGRYPTKVVYVSSLDSDLIRRDFTINTICMDSSGKIIDLMNGVDDLNKGLVCMLDNNINTRLKEDPLRILRAIRIATVLDFKIEDKLYESIKNNHSLVKTLSITRIKNELNKILLSKNYLKGLNYLRDTKICEDLGIKYDDSITYVEDICGMWAQLEISKNYAFTKRENANIINIKDIIKYGNIDNYILYKYGLYHSLVAGEILHISKDTIEKAYNNLPLKEEKDLDVTCEEILEITHTLKKNLSGIKNELIQEILNNNLKNNKEDIIKYLKGSEYCVK